VLAVVLVVAIAGIAIAANANKSGPNTTASNPTAAPTNTLTIAPTDTPTQNSSATHHKVGDTVSTATWQVTINSAVSYAGNPDEFETPNPGDTYLVVEGTFKNLTSQSQTLSTLFMFELQDSQGNKYDEALLISVTGPDGTVLPNGPAHGKWGYEVPTSIHSFVLLFSDDFGQTAYVWDVSI
jgi:hypothetical protein